MKRHKRQLVLASSSPRRKEILRRLGIDFVPAKGDVHEPEHRAGELPETYVLKNAAAKVQSVSHLFRKALIIGADTVVVHRGSVMGKPRSTREAFRYLKRLSGAEHEVYTGIAIYDTEAWRLEKGFEKTVVRFRQLSDREIRAYLSVIDPLDKAGGYAIQGPGALIVEGITGCYYNVVGFPVARLEEMLLRHGVSLFDYMRRDTGSV